MKLNRTDVTADVLIVGNGGAGLRAAIEAADQGCHALVLSKLAEDRPNSTTLILGWGAHREAHEVESYFSEVVTEGNWLSDQELAWTYASEVPVRMPELREFGVDMRLEEAEQERPGVVRPLWYLPGPRGRVGESVSQALRRAALSRGVELRYDTQVTRLLTCDGTVVGATAVHAGTGEILVISAGAVILATGGSSRLFARNNNPAGTTGDGFALAYRAGAELVDMEFDTFCVPHPQLVRLFTDGSSEAEILASASGAHYSCGGIRVDAERRTSTPGLYAAGECAGGTFGAARLGSTSVAEIVISGHWAGHRAAAMATGPATGSPVPSQIDDEIGRLEHWLQSGVRDPEEVRGAIQEVMWRKVGPIRREETLAEAQAEFEAMASQICTLRAASWSELCAAAEIDLMLDAARITAAAAYSRTESRGAHWRLDFPRPGNEQWLANQVVRRSATGIPEVSKRPVAMTRIARAGECRVGTRWSWGYISDRDR